MAYDENLYAKIVSGELSEQEINQLKASGEWQEIQAILQVTDELSLPRHNKEQGYDNLLKKRGQASLKNKRRRLPLYQMVSAAAVILLLIGFFFFNRNKEISTFASNGTTESLLLSDNSEVVLNDGSSLYYKNTSDQASRIVRLNGEAFFKVTSGNTFTVETANGQVQVLGTQFNVRAWGNTLFVSCYSGKVAVISNNNRTILNPKDAIIVRDGNITRAPAETRNAPDWLTGTSRVYEEPLDEVFKELERQYNIKITRPDVNRIFSGSFTQNNLEEALEVICQPMGLQFKVVNNEQVTIYE